MVRQNGTRGQLIVTGSSAGGIEALSVILGALPANFPAPVVVAQHLDPRVPSSLASILSKQTALHVVAVTDTAHLEPAAVYIVPADRHVEIADDTVRVHDGAPGRPKPSIDLLFESAAQAFGDHLIAVVLTGMGSDGTNGARAVKAAGGTVIIEDPLTASFPSMPASLEPTMVDIIAPLEMIGPELVRLVDGSVDVPDDSPALDELLERIRITSGIDFSHYKQPTIKRRLARQMALSGHTTIVEYIAFLDANPAEFGKLVTNFLIKVTEFFRDRELYETLRTSIIPELIAEARQRSGRELRIWSAGCATGEEAYSLGILVADALGDELGAFGVRIFATDIDDAAIAFARRGIYPRESLRTLTPDLIERYFIETPEGWEIAKRVRNLTVFGRHDLGQRAPFPRIDLALCRNVLIYFSRDLQARTLQIFAFSLRNGGYLALGKAETTNPLADFFTVADPVLRIFRRSGDRVTIPAAQVHSPAAGVRESERARSTFPAFTSGPAPTRGTINDKLGAFLTTSSIGVILVDRHYDIISINASAREMFNIHGAAIGEDVVHLGPPDTSAQIRAMLDLALRNLQPTAGGQEVAIGSDGTEEPRYLALSCYPEIGDTARDVTGAVILAVDVTELARARHASEFTIGVKAREIEQLRRSEAYARDRQREITAASKELALVNSELRAQNDALLIGAEEAEAATEEIETLNEEMQATNEELETLNEEFQATIEELNTTNAEHEARTNELEAQRDGRAGEQGIALAQIAALTAIVDGLSTAVAAIDANGTIVTANQLFREIQNSAGETAVQIDDDAGATISFNVVLRRAAEGHTFGFRYLSIAPDQSRRSYGGTVHPLPDNAGARSIVTLEPMADAAR